MAKRRLESIGVRLGVAALVSSTLAACAGLSSFPFEAGTGPGEQTEVVSSELGPPPAKPAGEIDPLVATPPTDDASAGAGSQRVPLGSLNTIRPSASAPASGPSAPETPAIESSAPAMRSTEQGGMNVAPATTDEPESSPAQPASVQTKDAPLAGEARPAADNASPKTELPRLHSDRPVGRGPKSLYDEGDGDVQSDDGTVIISSSTPQREILSREFIPASARPPMSQDALPSLGQIPLTAAEKNTVRRFEILQRLQEESLITREEFSRRRNANIGALLPYTHEPPAAGLGRSVPSADAIVARLAALKRAFEMRAITAQQHALERTMILNALLPESPDRRDRPRPPPEDVIAGAALVGHLEELRRSGLITASELNSEKAAIEHVLRTGSFPSETDSASAASGNSATRDAQQEGQSKGQLESQGRPESQRQARITGPVLHLASFRSEQSARQGWEEVQKRNPEILGSLQPIIRRVDLGPEQGIFYRLMTGSFSSLSEAEAACIRLKENNQFCRASPDGT